jgi:1-acyl-sn-glycerol-3-phosphate acyltransferase
MSCLSTRGPDLPHHTNMTATVRSNPTVNPAENPPASPAATSHEGFWRRLRRRLLTVPLVFAVTILFVTTLPLLLLVAALIDLLRGRLVLCRGLLFFVTFLLLESVAIGGVTLLWFVHLILRDEAFFVRANRAAQTWWSTALYRSGEYFFSLRTHIEGSLPPPDPDTREVPPLLVFVRHSSTADTVLPVVLLATRGYRLRYVLKRELLLDPCLDIVGQRLRNYFVARGGKETDQDLHGIDALAADLGSGDALVIYPEGTRFTAAKRARILTRLREQGPADTLALADSLTQTLPPLQRGPLRLLGTESRCGSAADRTRRTGCRWLPWRAATRRAGQPRRSHPHRADSVCGAAPRSARPATAPRRQVAADRRLHCASQEPSCTLT